MVHKYVETTPETVMSQLQMLGHANSHVPIKQTVRLAFRAKQITYVRYV